MNATRHIAGLGAILITGLMLTGCAPAGGQSAADAQEQLESIDGVTKSYVDMGTSWNGFNRVDNVTLSVELEPGLQPTPEFFDYLVETAWSVNDQKPNPYVAVFVYAEPEADVDGISAAAGWAVPSASGQERVALVQIDEIEARFGPWPGEPPEAPTDGLIAITPESTRSSDSTPR